MVTRLKRLFGGSPGGDKPFTVFVVQHAEARDGSAHLGLSARGREQAAAFASSMKRGDVDVFVTGPVQASIETARTMQSSVGGELVELAEFGGPTQEETGGTTGTAAHRYLEGLEAIRARVAPTHRVMVVTDGERTLGAVRTMRSDAQIEVEAPGTFEQGIPPCAMTTFVWRDGVWDVDVIAALTIPDI